MLIPFNIILLFTRRLSRFRCINKFKPLLDAYQGPYKDEYYYWTGLQLVIRVIFFGISTLERNLNFTVGSIVLSATGILQGYCNPYKVKQKNINELLLLSNLLVLYGLSNYVNNAVVVNVMIIIAAVHFMFIVTYHIITYVYGGVIRNKTLMIISSLRKLITPSKRTHGEALELRTFLRRNIPDATKYCEYQQPLVALD